MADCDDDDIGCLSRNISSSCTHGETNIGLGEGRRVVDSVAQIAHRLSASLKRVDDPLLLLGIDFGEKDGALDMNPQGFILQFGKAAVTASAPMAGSSGASPSITRSRPTRCRPVSRTACWTSKSPRAGRSGAAHAASR